MLFLFAFSIGRNSAAALVHLSFLMLLPLLMILYGMRFGFTLAAAAFAAILVVFVTPLVGWEGSVAYNDVALATVVFAAVYPLQMWWRYGDSGYLLASSLLAGYACAIKYTGIFVLFLVAGTLLWERRRQSPALVASTLLIAGAVMAALPLPYLVRNWVWFRDPIAPFATSTFPNPYFRVSLEKDLIRGNAHVNGIEWRDLPRELTFGGSKLPSNLGPIYVLAPLAFLGGRGQKVASWSSRHWSPAAAMRRARMPAS